jgi:hypothetical protein
VPKSAGQFGGLFLLQTLEAARISRDLKLAGRTLYMGRKALKASHFAALPVLLWQARLATGNELNTNS